MHTKTELWNSTFNNLYNRQTKQNLIAEIIALNAQNPSRQTYKLFTLELAGKKIFIVFKYLEVKIMGAEKWCCPALLAIVCKQLLESETNSDSNTLHAPSFYIRNICQQLLTICYLYPVLNTFKVKSLRIVSLQDIVYVHFTSFNIDM